LNVIDIPPTVLASYHKRTRRFKSNRSSWEWGTRNNEWM